jgi:hypothetical protein
LGSSSTIAVEDPGKEGASSCSADLSWAASASTHGGYRNRLRSS